MSKRVDVIGLRNGMIEVIADASRRSGGRRVVARCDCGTVQEMYLSDVKRSRTGSCGCLMPALVAEMSTKHGHATHRGTTPEYAAWKGILRRCLNERCREFFRYGGRGITVCDAWRESFSSFLAHIGLRPSPSHSIDRIDNERGYEPGNVRWATRTEQMRNTRRNHRVTAFGETMTISEWGVRVGIHPVTIYRRIQRGLSPEQAISR